MHASVCVCVCVCCLCLFYIDNSSTDVIAYVTAAIFIGIFAIILASLFIVYYKKRRASKSCNV